jgi:hypothetical protein
MSIQTSPSLAPDYVLYRENITQPDDMANITKDDGCNASMFEYVHVQVTTGIESTTNVEIWWWSDVANAFIRNASPIEVIGGYVGQVMEFTVETRGRIFFIQVTYLSPEPASSDIMVSGFNRSSI